MPRGRGYSKEWKRSEHAEQRAYFDWVRIMINQDVRFRNIKSDWAQGKRTFATAAWMRAEGAQAGFPDISILWPNEQYHGLFIELKSKTKGAKPTHHQLDWIERLNRAGYLAVVCYGAEQAIEQTKRYLYEKSNPA